MLQLAMQCQLVRKSSTVLAASVSIQIPVWRQQLQLAVDRRRCSGAEASLLKRPAQQLSAHTPHHLPQPRTPKITTTHTEDSGFFKAIEEGKTEEEALAIAQGSQPTIHTPYEPARLSVAAAATQQRAAAQPVVHSVVERGAAAPSYGFAARFLQ